MSLALRALLCGDVAQVDTCEEGEDGRVVEAGADFDGDLRVFEFWLSAG